MFSSNTLQYRTLQNVQSDILLKFLAKFKPQFVSNYSNIQIAIGLDMPFLIWAADCMIKANCWYRIAAWAVVRHQFTKVSLKKELKASNVLWSMWKMLPAPHYYIATFWSIKTNNISLYHSGYFKNNWAIARHIYLIWIRFSCWI